MEKVRGAPSQEVYLFERKIKGGQRESGSEKWTECFFSKIKERGETEGWNGERMKEKQRLEI